MIPEIGYLKNVNKIDKCVANLIKSKKGGVNFRITN